MRHPIHFLLSILLLSTIHFAALLIVNGTGAPAYCLSGGVSYAPNGTIQDAIDAATAGDTIIVCKNGTSTYMENVILNKSLSIYGNETGVIVNASNIALPIFNISTGPVNISNFTVREALTGYGIYTNASNSSISNITIYNNSHGIYISSGSDNNISLSTIFNNSLSGIYLTGIASSGNRIFSNNIYGHTLGPGPGIVLHFVNATNHIYSNLIIENNTRGIFLNHSNFTILSNNTAARNSFSGVDVNVTSNTTITNNNANNNSLYGFYIGPGARYNTLTNNTAINNSFYAFYVVGGTNALQFNSNNTFVNNTANSNTIGFYLAFSSNDILLRNSADNNSQYGFYLWSSGAGRSDNLTLINNSANNNSLYGFFFSDSNNNNLTDNIADGNSQLGFWISSGNSTITNNSATGNYQIGFRFQGVGSNLSSNTAINNSRVQFDINSNTKVNFTGTNYAYQTPSGALDLNITGGSILTGNDNNFTTDQMTLAFTTLENLTLKTSFLAGTGASETLCVSSAFRTCRLVSELMEFGNLSGQGIITGLVTYYNFSKITGGITETDVYLGKWSAGWNQIGRTSQDTTAHSVTYNSVTSFSFWGAVGFVGASSSGCTDCGDTSGNDPLSLSVDLEGNIVTITATSKGAAVSGATIKLIYNPTGVAVGEEVTDADGKVVFTLTDQGMYRTRTTPPSGYDDPEELEFEYTAVEGPEEPPEIPPEVPPEVPPAPPVEPPTPSVVIQPPPPPEPPPVQNVSVVTPPTPPAAPPEEEKIGLLTLENITKGILLLILTVAVILGVLYYIRKRGEGKSYKFEKG